MMPGGWVEGTGARWSDLGGGDGTGRGRWGSGRAGSRVRVYVCVSVTSAPAWLLRRLRSRTPER